MELYTPDSGRIEVSEERDLVRVRKAVRDACSVTGFGLTDITRIVTAASELARNIYRYAGEGEMRWNGVNDGKKTGIKLIFEDHGPGIADIETALSEGFSTGRSMGMGLPGAKRLMDEVESESGVDQGTKVVVCKWMQR